MAMRIATDEVLELARRYEASGGFETTLGDSLRPRVRDELNRIARRTVNRDLYGRDFIIAMLITLALTFFPLACFRTIVSINMAVFFAMCTVGAFCIWIFTYPDRHWARDDANDEDYGKLLAAYRMLGGDESRLEPYVGIDTAERVAAVFRERSVDDDGAAPAGAEPRDIFLD